MIYNTNCDGSKFRNTGLEAVRWIEAWRVGLLKQKVVQRLSDNSPPGVTLGWVINEKIGNVFFCDRK